MSRSKLSFSNRRRLNTSIKVAALFSALAFVTVVLEQPRLTAAPNHPRASTEQGPYQASERVPADVATASAATTALSVPKPSESLPTFFPGQFAAPSGPVDTQPPTF
jgi:hypothetical protein